MKGQEISQKSKKQEMTLSRQTLAGLRMTCQSVPEIVRIVLAAGASFVLTSHINQDPLWTLPVQGWVKQ